jgi:hypothetical protein
MGRKGGIEVENLVREFPKGPRAVDARSFLAGEPASSLPAYAIGFAFAFWALFRLRREGGMRRKGGQ